MKSNINYLRFSFFHRFCHFLIIVSFFGLVLTGVPLAFKNYYWARWLYELFGGYPTAGLFIAFVPYAASVPYEVWILPLRHETSFADLQPDDITPLAQILQDILAKLYYSLNNPDYNYCINTVPHYSCSEPYYHWHIQILPRLSTRAGFEIGSGININVALPEESAKFLREFEVK